MLRVFADQLKSGSGDAFVDTFLSDLSAEAARYNPPPNTVATDSQQLGGHLVTHFYSFVAAEGYTYAEGPRSSSTCTDHRPADHAHA